MWLTTPRTATDIWGDTYNVRALQWLAFPDSTLVVQWSDHTVDDTFTRQLRDDPDMATLFAAGASIYDVSVIPDYPASSDTAVLLHADQPADVEQLRAMARAHINASTRDSEFHRNRRLAQIEGMDAAALLSMFTGSAQDRFLHALWTVTASRPAQTPRLRESTTKHARQRLARWAPDNPQDAYEHASRIEVHP